MEPQKDESENGQKPEKEKRRGRFRIVKLEERIAPRQGGNGSNNSCYFYCGGGSGNRCLTTR